MFIGVLAIIISPFGFAESTYAHFLVEDTRTGVKAILHVAPDDDPIAGQESVISFDFSKTKLQASAYSYSLEVRPTKGHAVTIPLQVQSNVVLASYTFPSQGFYDIILTTTSRLDGSQSNLQYGQTRLAGCYC